MKPVTVSVPVCSSEATAVAACWQRRLDFERKHGLEQGDETLLKTWQMRLLVAAATVGLKALGLYEQGRRNARTPLLRREDIVLKGMPLALDGLRILHLSDFHFPRADEPFVAALTRLLSGIETDCCVLTGDYKYGHYGPADHVPGLLKRVLAGVQSRHGVQAILGNHDLASMVPMLEALGIDVLLNRGVALEHNGASLWLGGVDDPHKYRAANLAAAFADAPLESFRIALVHTPECIDEAAALGARLYLCGHTHGGQLRLPLLGAIKLNARCPREYTRGHWNFGAMHGYTTDGLGVTDFPLRFNCPPEACLFTLRCAGD